MVYTLSRALHQERIDFQYDQYKLALQKFWDYHED